MISLGLVGYFEFSQISPPNPAILWLLFNSRIQMNKTLTKSDGCGQIANQLLIFQRIILIELIKIFFSIIYISSNFLFCPFVSWHKIYHQLFCIGFARSLNTNIAWKIKMTQNNFLFTARTTNVTRWTSSQLEV